MDSFQRGIVRLFRKDGSPNGKTLGTGFIVHADGLVVTCAHVLEKEAGVPSGSQSVSLEFRANGTSSTAKVLPGCWRASDREDVAVLQLDVVPDIESFISAASESTGEEEKTKRPVALTLGYSAHLGGASVAKPRRLRTFGYPQAKTVEGLPDVCDVVGTATENGYKVFTLRAGNVSYGYSGSPVWDDELGAVVGVNVSIIEPGVDMAGRQAETAFFTPIETIRSACDRLKLPDDQPYRNLDAFEEKHEGYYFGREAASAQLANLMAAHDVGAVIGVSGSGKSSLVRAGLLKGLSVAKSPLISRPRVTFLAGANPLLAMITALQQLGPHVARKVLELFGLSDTADGIEAAKQIGGQSVDQLTSSLKAFGSWQPVVLICDQFERLYTESATDSTRARFISVLLGSACRDVKIVIAVRADYYYNQVQDEKGLIRAVGNAELVLKPLEPDDLRRAIENPARVLFRHFQPSVVEDMIREVSERPGDLPLLQFALTELWQVDNTKGVLTEKSYRELGAVDATGNVTVPGVRGAIVRRADEYYQRLASDQERERCRRLFRLLVNTSSGAVTTVGRDISRRALAGELDRPTLALANQLADTFLLTPREDPLTRQRTFEVAHEALIRSWPLLREWDEQQRGWSIWYQTVLYPDFREWLAREKSPDFYLRSKAVLDEAQRWLLYESADANGEVHDYVRASVKSEKERQVEEDRRQRRDARRRRLVWQISVVSAAVVIVIGMFLVQSKRHEAVVAARDLQQRGILALQSHANLEAGVFFSTALTLDDRPETRQLLIQTLARGARLEIVRQLDGDVVAIGSDALTLATARSKGPLHVIRGIDQPHQSVEVLPAHDGTTERAAISLDGRWIAWDTHADPSKVTEANTANSLHIWDDREQREKTIDVGDRPISSIAFSSDNSILAFATERGLIKLLNLPNMDVRATLAGHIVGVWGLAISSGNSFLASSGSNLDLRLWSLRDINAKPVPLKGHSDVIYSVAFSPNGQILASGSTDSTIRLWDVAHPTAVPRVLHGDQGQFNCLDFSPDGHLLAGGAEDRTVRIWDADAAVELQKLSVHEGDVDHVKFTPDGGGIVAGGKGGWLRRWRLDDRAVAFQVYASGPVATSVFKSDGKSVFAGGQDGIVREWQWPNTAIARELCAHGPRVLCLAANPKTSLVAWASDDNRVHLYDYKLSHDMQIIQLKAPNPENKQFEQIWSIAFSRDGRRLACANFDRTIHIFERSSETSNYSEVQVFNTEKYGAVFAVAFGMDSSVLGSAGGDKLARIWTVNSTTEPRTFAGHDGELWGLAFSPDRKHFATGGTDREIRIWDINQQEPCRVLSGHTALVNSIDYSPDGQWLASGSNDQTIRLWNFSSGASVVLRAAAGPIWWVAFSPSGRWLTTAGLDGYVRIWDVAAINGVMTRSPNQLRDESIARAGEAIDVSGNVVNKVDKNFP